MVLREIAVVFGVGVAVAWLFRVVRVPSVIGFLITGLAIGPAGWCLVPAEHVLEFSELGLILLLFTTGLELSPDPLLRSGKRLLGATLIQSGATAAAVVGVLLVAGGLGWAAMAVVGVAVSLSSTAILLKQMSDRGETTSTAGLISTGILLVQDVIVILMLLAVSLARGQSGESWVAAIGRSAGGLCALTVIVFGARKALPFILSAVARHGGRELIALFAVLMASGGAWLAHAAGWSPALGACIAGLLLAGADERHQLVAEITPFRDVFNALFFVSLGMSVNATAAMGHLTLLIAAIAATIVIKAAIAAGAVCAAGWPLRMGIRVGIGLCTVSEFSYVLVLQVRDMGMLSPGVMDLMVAFAVGTMMIGALLFPVASPLAEFVSRRLYPDARDGAPRDTADETVSLENHVILVGYGVTGTNLSRMLRSTSIPHCIVEMNQGLVAAARRAGAQVVVGDATRMAILEHAGIDQARVLVVAANDKQATQRIVAQCSARRPALYILARTSFISDIDALYARGARLVIPQDFETSVEVAAHVLKQFGVPDNIIEAQVAAVRAGGYGMLRGKPADRAAHAELVHILERTTTQTFYLGHESPACGQTLTSLNLRALTGCTVIAIVRQGEPTTNPGPSFRFQENDVLVLVGAHRQIEAAKALLRGGAVPKAASETSAETADKDTRAL